MELIQSWAMRRCHEHFETASTAQLVRLGYNGRETTASWCWVHEEDPNHARYQNRRVGHTALSAFRKSPGRENSPVNRAWFRRIRSDDLACTCRFRACKRGWLNR